MFKVGDRVRWTQFDGSTKTDEIRAREDWSDCIITKIAGDDIFVDTYSFDGYEGKPIKGLLDKSYTELVKEGEQMKTWGEMSDEEKGALLLAHHEGKVIERFEDGNMGGWVLVRS